MEDTNKKMHSRKFIVWLVATVFFLGSLVYGFITKLDDLALAFIPWWGGISLTYLGANAAGKFAPVRPEAEAPATEE